jgi:hypothetical protein
MEVVGMTKDDESRGWLDAPAAKYWKCPQCGRISPIADWRQVEFDCDLCGSHDGRECPSCGEWFDYVSSSDIVGVESDCAE